MDAVLDKFSGRITDSKSLINTVEQIKREYIDDGLTKEELPGLVSTLMLAVNDIKNMEGIHKKKLVISILNHLIEEIEPGDKDTEFEIILKSMVPPMIDGFSKLLKTKKALAKLCSCLA
jgi:hypothetical protein